MLDPRFNKFDHFMFDLDGTVWLWTKLIDGSKKVITELYRTGKSVYFITNNTALTRAGYAAKLRSFGIEAGTEQIVNPSLPAIRLFKGKKVFVLAEGIASDLRKAGIEVTAKDADAVLIGEDRNINYNKLSAAVSAMDSGAKSYKSASGGIWLMGKRHLIGTGAIAAAIEAATGKKAELIGKPSHHMLKEMRRLALHPAKTLIIGDELHTDIEAGNRLGWSTALVLTGNSTRKDARRAKGVQKPHFILNSVGELFG